MQIHTVSQTDRHRPHVVYTGWMMHYETSFICGKWQCTHGCNQCLFLLIYVYNDCRFMGGLGKRAMNTLILWCKKKKKERKLKNIWWSKKKMFNNSSAYTDQGKCDYKLEKDFHTCVACRLNDSRVVWQFWEFFYLVHL